MDNLPINVTDLVIFVVVLISGALAFVRGFVHEVLAMAAWIGAAVATVYGLPHVLPFARDLIAIKIFAEIAAGASIFILVLIGLSILTHMLSRNIRESSLGAIDRSLGLLFGFLRGAFLICVVWIVLLWGMPREDHPTWISEARALPLVEQGAQAILEALPESLRPDLADSETGGPSLQLLIKPEISSPGRGDSDEAGPEGDAGYKDTERKDLQRLLETAK